MSHGVRRTETRLWGSAGLLPHRRTDSPGLGTAVRSAVEVSVLYPFYDPCPGPLFMTLVDKSEGDTATGPRPLPPPCTPATPDIQVWVTPTGREIGPRSGRPLPTLTLDPDRPSARDTEGLTQEDTGRRSGDKALDETRRAGPSPRPPRPAPGTTSVGRREPGPPQGRLRTVTPCYDMVVDEGDGRPLDDVDLRRASVGVWAAEDVALSTLFRELGRDDTADTQNPRDPVRGEGP